MESPKEISSLEIAAKLDYENIVATETLVDAPTWDALSSEQRQALIEEYRYYEQVTRSMERCICELSEEIQAVQQKRNGTEKISS